MFCALILTMLSLSGCASLVDFLNTTDRTLQDFDRLLQNSETNYRRMQNNFNSEHATDTTIKR